MKLTKKQRRIRRGITDADIVIMPVVENQTTKEVAQDLITTFAWTRKRVKA